MKALGDFSTYEKEAAMEAAKTAWLLNRIVQKLAMTNAILNNGLHNSVPIQRPIDCKHF